MSAMNLSPKVSLLTATKSDTAIRFGIDNTPNQVQLENMRRVSEKVIEPILSRYPWAFVSSFFRSPALNRKIGGAKNSQHMNGEAVDIDSPDNKANLDIFNFVKDELVYDQVILEAPDADGVPSWVHVSLKNTDNRGQILVYLASTKKYLPYGLWTKGMV
jgi:hypothetical protein